MRSSWPLDTITTPSSISIAAPIIETLRAAETLPFEEAEWRSHKAMFPIMAQWLPQADGDELVRAFQSEMNRLA